MKKPFQFQMIVLLFGLAICLSPAGCADAPPSEPTPSPVIPDADMLIDDSPATLDSFDSGRMDIDGDGIDEDYWIGFGPTYGLFTYHIRASANGEEKYSDLFNSEFYSAIRFRCDADDTVTLRATRADGSERILSVTTENGHLVLTDADGSCEALWSWLR